MTGAWFDLLLHGGLGTDAAIQHVQRERFGGDWRPNLCGGPSMWPSAQRPAQSASRHRRGLFSGAGRTSRCEARPPPVDKSTRRASPAAAPPAYSGCSRRWHTERSASCFTSATGSTSQTRRVMRRTSSAVGGRDRPHARTAETRCAGQARMRPQSDRRHSMQMPQIQWRLLAAVPGLSVTHEVRS